MMSSTDPATQEAAIRWVIRLKHAAAEDWEEFTEWLEADPAHASAYERMALVDEEVGALPPRQVSFVQGSPVQPEERRFSRRAFAGWGVAAAVLLTVGMVSMQPGADTSYVVATAAGEQRVYHLADGSRIDLNGSTRIVLDREEPRLARLEQGEALFTVVHKETSPFQVYAGDNLIYDVGTVFNVVNLGDEVRVAVAEGAVIFNPRQEAVNLTAGMSLEKEGTKVSVSRGDVEAAGAWSKGRLIYAGAPISDVAADLSRNLGVPVAAEPGLANKRFTGVLRLDGEPGTVVARASALIGSRTKRLNQGWILTSG